MKDFSDRTGAAPVVGGSGGLGLATSRVLAGRGSDVALTYCSRPEAAAAAVEAAREWGVHASAYLLDLGVPTAAADAAATARYLGRPGETRHQFPGLFAGSGWASSRMT